MRKDFKPFCAKFRPVGLKNLNKTFLSYEKCSFRYIVIPGGGGGGGGGLLVTWISNIVFCVPGNQQINANMVNTTNG